MMISIHSSRKFSIWGSDGEPKFRPHVRYQMFDEDVTPSRTVSQTDIGVDYIMKGHDARLTLNYAMFDDDLGAGTDWSEIRVGLQLQF